MSSSTSTTSTEEGGGALQARRRCTWSWLLTASSGQASSASSTRCVATARSPHACECTWWSPQGPRARSAPSLRCHGVAREHLEVLGFSAARLPKIKVSTLLTNLESPLNFARFYLHELLPAVPRVLCGPAGPLRRCLLCTHPFTVHLPTVHLPTVHLLTVHLLLCACSLRTHLRCTHLPRTHVSTMHLLIPCAPAVPPKVLYLDA